MADVRGDPLLVSEAMSHMVRSVGTGDGDQSRPRSILCQDAVVRPDHDERAGEGAVGDGAVERRVDCIDARDGVAR